MNPRERTVLIFLIAALFVGAGVNVYRRVRRQRQLATIAVVHPAVAPAAPDSQFPIPNSRCPAPIPDSQSLIPDTCPLAPVLIDLNTATAAELDLLPGIGPALSQRIMDYRTANHGFQNKEELLKVSGIGPRKYAAIKDRVCTEAQR